MTPFRADALLLPVSLAAAVFSYFVSCEHIISTASLAAVQRDVLRINRSDIMSVDIISYRSLRLQSNFAARFIVLINPDLPFG